MKSRLKFGTDQSSILLGTHWWGGMGHCVVPESCPHSSSSSSSRVPTTFELGARSHHQMCLKGRNSRSAAFGSLRRRSATLLLCSTAAVGCVVGVAEWNGWHEPAWRVAALGHAIVVRCTRSRSQMPNRLRLFPRDACLSRDRHACCDFSWEGGQGEGPADLSRSLSLLALLPSFRQGALLVRYSRLYFPIVTWLRYSCAWTTVSVTLCVTQDCVCETGGTVFQRRLWGWCCTLTDYFHHGLETWIAGVGLSSCWRWVTSPSVSMVLEVRVGVSGVLPAVVLVLCHSVPQSRLE